MVTRKKKTRKKKDPELIRSEPITFKVTPAMKEQIEQAALNENRSVSSYIINALDRYLKL